MQKVYINFDNTVVEINRRVIEILNKNYNLSKTEDDLKDFEYMSIAPITTDEKITILESDDLFSNLTFKNGFLEVIEKYHNKFQFVIIANGTDVSLNKKKVWIDNNIPYSVDFIGLPNSYNIKKDINMANGIHIDECVSSLESNAQMKILYKDGHNFDWQSNYENTEILVVNTWEQIDEILSFYSLYDYKTLDGVK